MFASENGLKVTVEDAKCLQANAFIQSGLFQEFILRQEQTTFKICLTVLLVSIYRTAARIVILSVSKVTFARFLAPLCPCLQCSTKEHIGGTGAGAY